MGGFSAPSPPPAPPPPPPPPPPEKSSAPDIASEDTSANAETRDTGKERRRQRAKSKTLVSLDESSGKSTILGS